MNESAEERAARRFVVPLVPAPGSVLELVSMGEIMIGLVLFGLALLTVFGILLAAAQ